ncbi:hypothetical protein SAMN05892883_2063 [Jatrophihabitans sp. GAS493]|nr:hypothetical protein SAMN05892883_2063 [Jatrophihabitans sp. GAS493]
MINKTREKVRAAGDVISAALVRYVIYIGEIAIGLSYIFGPPRFFESPIYDFIHQSHIPNWMFGVLFISAGLLVAFPNFRTRILGYGLGFTLRSAFAVSALVATLDGKTAGITAITDWGALAVINLICLKAVTDKHFGIPSVARTIEGG